MSGSVPSVAGIPGPLSLPTSNLGGAALAFDWDASRNVFSDVSGTVPCAIGDAVETWTDNIGAFNAQQTTANLRPTLAIDQNNFRCIQFNGTLTQSLSAAFNAAFQPLVGMYTVFLVVRNLSDDSNMPILLSGNTASTIQGWSFFIDAATGLVVGRCSATPTSNRASQTLPVLCGSTPPTLFTLQMTGSQVNCFINGSATNWVNGGDGPAGNTYTGTINNTDALTFGINGANFGSMLLYRAVAYKGTLTAAALTQITNQLLAIYRLAVFPVNSAAIISPSSTTALWTSGTDFYRIPALASDGTTVIAACEHRFLSASDGGHIQIETRKSTDNGATWAAAVVAASNTVNCSRNPSLVADPGRGKFHMVYCNQLATATEAAIIAGTATNTVMYTFSIDGGATWAAGVDITSQVLAGTWRWFAPGPGAGVITPGGRIVIGCDHSDPANAGVYQANSIYSDDGGTTWHASAAFGAQGTNETTVAIMPSGQIVANSRINAVAFRQDTRSEDSGSTWGVSATRNDEYGTATEGQILYVSPWLIKSGIVASSRTNLGVWLSGDGGRTWPRRSRAFTGTSGYSSLCPMPNGKVGLLYEQGASAFIEFETFSLP